MLKVLGRITSINVRKVLWALDELGLSYEREDWGQPLRDPQVPEFLALNPNGQVPVLLDGNFSLWESNAILLYLAEKYSALLPPGIEERGLSLQWLSWQVSELGPSWGYAVMALIRNTPGYDDPNQITASMQRWGGKMAILEAQLAKGNDFVVGDSFSVADIALGLSIHRWISIPLAKPEFPAVSAYYQRLVARPAGAQWMTAATP